MVFVKILPWRIRGGDMEARPFVFDDIKPTYPFYQFKKEVRDGVELYQPVFYYRSDGCCMSGRKLHDDFIDMESAKAVCQDHFNAWIYSMIEER